MTALARMLAAFDTAANFTGDDPVLRYGEMGVETDTDKLKIGDGVTAWTALDYVRGGTNQTITLTGDVTGSGTGSFATTIATAQPSAHTWAATQTFTVAPVFTNQSGTRSALGLGTAATQNTGTSGATLPFANGNNTWGGTNGFQAVTATSVASSGALTSSSSSAGAGYVTGAGGTVTQITSKGTAVTINRPCGQITTHNAALANGAVAAFVVNNSLVTASDNVVLTLQNAGSSAVSYRYWIVAVNAGSFAIMIENRSGGSLSEALVFNFAIIKGATS